MEGRKEGNVLFNDVLNTFCLQLYGIAVSVKISNLLICIYSFDLSCSILGKENCIENVYTYIYIVLSY